MHDACMRAVWLQRKNICVEMKMARLEFICPERGREMQKDWRLTARVQMELSAKAFVNKKEEDAERSGIMYECFPHAKAPSKTPSLPDTPKLSTPLSVAMEEQLLGQTRLFMVVRGIPQVQDLAKTTTIGIG